VEEEGRLRSSSEAAEKRHRLVSGAPERLGLTIVHVCGRLGASVGFKRVLQRRRVRVIIAAQREVKLQTIHVHDGVDGVVTEDVVDGW
jgi:hypothetical protein